MGQASFVLGESRDFPSLASSDEECLVDGASLDERLHRVIQRLVSISQREENLAGRAIVMSVIPDNPEEVADSVVPEIAHRFEIEEARWPSTTWGW